MTAVSHAERIAKRHARLVAARSVVTPARSAAGGPELGRPSANLSEPNSERCGEQQRFEEIEAAGDGRDQPGATMNEGDDAPRSNPFAQFMGCAP